MNAFLQIFAEFGSIREQKADSQEAQQLVRKLHTFINENFYSCSEDILYSLGQMYVGGGEFTKNIDEVGGEGTAAFTAAAIEVYCGKSV